MDRPILPRVERPVSRLVLGQSAAAEDLPQLYDRFVELGGNAFETARWYPTEPVLGDWLAGRTDRDELFVITKGCHPAVQDGPPRVNPAAIRRDLAESLARLRIDRVDLFLLHRDDETVPVGEILTALAEQRAAGRIGAAGGSNWTTSRLEAAAAWARDHDVPPFEVGSPNLALALATRPPWSGCVVVGARPVVLRRGCGRDGPGDDVRGRGAGRRHRRHRGVRLGGEPRAARARSGARPRARADGQPGRPGLGPQPAVPDPGDRRRPDHPRARGGGRRGRPPPDPRAGALAGRRRCRLRRRGRRSGMT